MERRPIFCCRPLISGKKLPLEGFGWRSFETWFQARQMHKEKPQTILHLPVFIQQWEFRESNIVKINRAETSNQKQILYWDWLALLFQSYALHWIKPACINLLESGTIKYQSSADFNGIMFIWSCNIFCQRYAPCTNRIGLFCRRSWKKDPLNVINAAV